MICKRIQKYYFFFASLFKYFVLKLSFLAQHVFFVFVFSFLFLYKNYLNLQNMSKVIFNILNWFLYPQIILTDFLVGWFRNTFPHFYTSILITNILNKKGILLIILMTTSCYNTSFALKLLQVWILDFLTCYDISDVINCFYRSQVFLLFL